MFHMRPSCIPCNWKIGIILNQRGQVYKGRRSIKGKIMVWASFFLVIKYKLFEKHTIIKL